MEKEIFERGGMEFKKRRVDLDQRAVIARLEERGFSVLNLSAVGQGCPDLLVGKNGQNFLLEIKSEKGTLTPAQIEFHKNWQGHCKIIKLESLGDFLNGTT
jgi:Holliday junction resolvase